MLGMRENLRSGMSIQVAKKQLMRLAWKDSGLDESLLETLFDGAVQPALVQTQNMNSFELFRVLKKTEAGRAAKPGDIAPDDIVVEKQDTGMAPGPVVGELNSVGIPAKIMGGSVHIQKTITVLKKGEVFEDDLGMLLSKIGINPIVIGLRLCGTLENGTIFDPEILDIDEEQFENDLIATMAGAFNLACNIRWFTAQTILTLLGKASSEALSIALEAGIANSKTLPMLISHAHVGALGVAETLDSAALDDDLRTMMGTTVDAAASAAAVQETTEEAPAEAAEEEEE